MAPECFICSEYGGIPADIWSLGVTIYCFYYNKLPFYSDDYEGLKEKIINDQYLLFYIIDSHFQMKKIFHKI